MDQRPTKSYPKRTLLPQFDDEALEPIPPKHKTTDEPDRPPRVWGRPATHAEHQPAPPRPRGKEVTAPGYTCDLCKDLDNRASMTRSIYGSRGHAPMREGGHQTWWDRHDLARAKNRIRPPSELRCDAARYRDAAHPLCFTDEVMEHQFP